MNELNKIIRVLVIAPIFFLAWCGLSYKALGYVPGGHIRTTILVTISCIVIGVLLFWMKRRAIRNRVYLHVKPNIIEVENAELFRGEFSSFTNFLVSTEEFQKTLRAVAGRKSYMQNRFMAVRESAYVRIWPEPMGISEVELDALTHALSDEFIELEVEVMVSRVEGAVTAIKA